MPTSTYPRHRQPEAPTAQSRPSRVAGILRVPEARWAALATGLFTLGGVAQVTGVLPWLWWSLYLACYAAGGWVPARAGLQALREKKLDVDLLMILAAIVAASIGQIFDGALLIVIFATSGALEALATKRTADSVRALLDLTPTKATRLHAGQVEERVATTELNVDDLVLIRPGELIGADAEVAGGSSEVDQASITGEPLPALKQPGDEVFAGTLNGTGALRVRVTRTAGESVIARIVTLVEEASATKARTQLFIEKVEQRYSIAMVTVTLGLFVLPLALGGALQPTLLRAITFMIVASPCAIVLATMPPLLSAIANAGRHGVLVKSAVVMEQLGRIDVVAFDKTGTLTEGAPVVESVHAQPDAGLEEDELLVFAAAAERPSEHPLAFAIVAAAHHRGLQLPGAEQFESAPGAGVRAVVAGSTVRVGYPVLLDGGSPATSAALRLQIDAAESTGRTAVVVLLDSLPAGVIVLSDRLRPDAVHTTQQLTTVTGSSPTLITGDNPRAARHIADMVGITDVHGSLLPADKVTRVRDIQADGHRVMVVGDGVNDAPALAAADLGVAMGRHGSDLALETADAVIVRDELATVPKIIDLSRRARRVVIANLIIAATVIAALVTWDLVGHLPLPLAVAGHEGSTVVVGLNGLRLLRNSVWERVPQH